MKINLKMIRGALSGFTSGLVLNRQVLVMGYIPRYKSLPGRKVLRKDFDRGLLGIKKCK